VTSDNCQLSFSCGAVRERLTQGKGAYKVLLENDRVRVLEYRLKPGAKEPMHSHTDYIVYALSSGKAKFTLPDGKTIECEIKARRYSSKQKRTL
jgi:quercetin dioxygenase-like cupin family protein